MAGEKETNGVGTLRVRTWQDIGVILAIVLPFLAMVFALVQWGLKLDDRQIAIKKEHEVYISLMERRVSTLETSVADGILPIAVILNEDLKRRVTTLEKESREHEKSEH